MRLHLVAATALAISTAGCAEITSIYRSAPLSGPDGKVVLIDAKQRVVTTTRTEAGDITCAEPSPDAFSVFASSIAGTFSVPEQASAQLAASLNETGANIGLRTPSIQLLRDVMYRVCEGYSSGAIDGATFATLHRRYQNVMIGLLAIEQLTGATRPSIITIGGSTRADVGSEVMQAQRNLDDAKLDEQKKKDDLEDRKTAAADALKDQTKEGDALKALKQKDPPAPQADIQAAEAKVKAAEEKKSAADKEVKDAETAAKLSTRVREKAEATLRAALSVGTSAESAFGRTKTEVSHPPSEKAATEVAKAVQTIVGDIVHADYSPDTCQTMVLNDKYITSASTDAKVYEAYKACLDFIIEKSRERASEAKENAEKSKVRAKAFQGDPAAIQQLQRMRTLGVQP